MSLWPFRLLAAALLTLTCTTPQVPCKHSVCFISQFLFGPELCVCSLVLDC